MDISETAHDQRPQTPVTVGLYHATADQLHDAFALASYLRVNDVPCQVRRFEAHTVKSEVAAELAQATQHLLLLAAGPDNLERVQSVAGLLHENLLVSLFGRDLRDTQLRGKVQSPPAHSVLVGEPYIPARDLARKVLARPEARGDFRVPGVLRSDRALTPLEPLRDLNVVPQGDYGFHDAVVARSIPMHTSRGYPHPCLMSARRCWESPVRRLSPARIVHDMALYAEDFGARHFTFTDLCFNTNNDELLQTAQGIVERELQTTWNARIWPDPALNRQGLHLLRRAGCRSLELAVFTASARLSEALQTGVTVAAVDRILADGMAEGIEVRPHLVVGLAWLWRNRQQLVSVSRLELCSLRPGAPLRELGEVYFPASGDSDQWHDGGVNTHSQRQTWLRELQAWLDHLGIWRPEQGSGFAPPMAGKVCERIARKVAATLPEDRAWKRQNLTLAGVLHGREAFCGPQSLQLDTGLLQRGEDAVADLLVQASAMGARRVVLGGGAGDEEADVVGCEALAGVAARARSQGLTVAVKTPLTAADADTLRLVGQQVQLLELEVRTEEQWALIERWVPVVTGQRQDSQLSLPQVKLRAWLAADGPGLEQVVQRAAQLGVDLLELKLARSEAQQLDQQQRQQARQELAQMVEQRSVAGPEAAHTLLQLPPGWPPGFSLESRPGGSWACTCPAGTTASELTQHGSDPTGLYARFAAETCHGCALLAGCPVRRQDQLVRLGLLQLLSPAALAEDLDDADCGLGRATQLADSQPCLVGWTEARVDSQGDLLICSRCGTEAVGNVLQEPLETVWYSRQLNEFRRMSLGASLAIPYVDRRVCAVQCHLTAQNVEIMEQLRDLPPSERSLLEDVGTADRRP